MAAKIEGGYILLPRNFFSSDLWMQKPFLRGRVFQWLVQKANFAKDRPEKGCPRGGLKASYIEASASVIEMTWRQWKTTIDYLVKSDRIKARPNGRGYTIQIVNYDEYQDPKSYTNGCDSGERTQAFTQCYAHHPKKIKEAAAWRQWVRATTGPRAVKEETIIDGHKRLLDAIKRGVVLEKYVVSLDRWIRDRRWRDKYEIAAAVAASEKRKRQLSQDARDGLLLQYGLSLGDDLFAAGADRGTFNSLVADARRTIGKLGTDSSGMTAVDIGIQRYELLVELTKERE
jgi:hypothetical protein